MKISSPLCKRLVSYTGMAATMLAANNQVANGQIIYTDVNPDHSYTDWNTSPYQLDINNDGIVDFEFYNTGYDGSGSTWCGSSSAYVNALGSNSIMTDGKPVDNGFLIGSQQDWDSNGHVLEVDCSWESGGGGFCNCHLNGNWKDDWESKFMGIKFVSNNNNYYGWIRLKAWGLTIEDYAFQSIPGEPIIAGAVENCDTLQVTVSPPDAVHVCALSEVFLVANYPSTSYNVNCHWQMNNIDIPNAFSQTLVVSEPGIYRAIIDGYGCADTTTAVPVTYNSIAPPPIITQHLDTLFSSPQSNYMWFKSTILLPGATNQFYVLSENGLYQCGYLDSLGCLSYLSNFYATTCAGTEVTIDQGSIGSICANESYILCATDIPNNSTYQWLLNGELIPGANYTCYDAVDPGYYEAVIEGYQGCTDTSAVFQLIVNSAPVPIITIVNDSVLQSSATQGNQWYFNGAGISGAIDQTYTALQFGMYEVIVTDSNNCSALSEPFYFYPIGISKEFKENDFILFTANNQLFVQFPQLPLHSKMKIVDLPGNPLIESIIDNTTMSIDVTSFAGGVYFVIIDNGKTQQVRKFFIGE